jgi:hypothetical protein
VDKGKGRTESICIHKKKENPNKRKSINHKNDSAIKRKFAYSGVDIIFDSFVRLSHTHKTCRSFEGARRKKKTKRRGENNRVSRRRSTGVSSLFLTGNPHPLNKSRPQLAQPSLTRPPFHLSLSRLSSLYLRRSPASLRMTDR